MPSQLNNLCYKIQYNSQLGETEGRSHTIHSRLVIFVSITILLDKTHLLTIFKSFPASNDLDNHTKRAVRYKIRF